MTRTSTTAVRPASAHSDADLPVMIDDHRVKKVRVRRGPTALVPAQVAAIGRIERLGKQFAKPFGKQARAMAVKEAKAERERASLEGDAERVKRLDAEVFMLERKVQRLWEWRRKLSASCARPIQITAPNSVFALGAAFSK